jgi:hypothetical protein
MAVLNRDVLKSPIKARGIMRLRVRKETTQYNEMNDKRLDIDMNVSDIARSVMDATAFRIFHGDRHLTMYI